MTDHPGPFIVLEGADGSGKSTLADQLSEMMGIPVEHYGPPETYAYDAWTNVVRGASGPRIFDRLHVGSFAYGRQFRGQDDLTPIERWKLDGLLTYYGAKIIYCVPPAWVMEENIAKGPRGPFAHYEQQQEHVRKDYDWFFNRAITNNSVPRPDYTTQLSVRHHDYTKDKPERAAEWATFHPSASPLPYTDLEGWEVYGNARNPKLRVAVTAGAWADCAYVPMTLRATGLAWPDLCVIVLDQDAYRADLIDETWVALGAHVTTRYDGENRIIDREIRIAPNPPEVAHAHFQEGLIRYPQTILGKDDWSP